MTHAKKLNKMPQYWNYQQTWFHGSPYQIDILLPGSTITQDIDLARVFSHKPHIVSMEDEPQGSSGFPRIRHNGQENGLLYRIDESITAQDVIPHPNSAMAPGFEWLTKRAFKLFLIGPVAIQPEELLSENDILELINRSGQ